MLKKKKKKRQLTKLCFSIIVISKINNLRLLTNRKIVHAKNSSLHLYSYIHVCLYMGEVEYACFNMYVSHLACHISSVTSGVSPVTYIRLYITFLHLCICPQPLFIISPTHIAVFCIDKGT